MKFRTTFKVDTGELKAGQIRKCLFFQKPTLVRLIGNEGLVWSVEYLTRVSKVEDEIVSRDTEGNRLFSNHWLD
jgi:hypothetical protein